MSDDDQYDEEEEVSLRGAVICGGTAPQRAPNAGNSLQKALLRALFALALT